MVMTERSTEEQSDLVEKVVHIRRVAKVVKGGRNLTSTLSSWWETARATSASASAKARQCLMPSARGRRSHART